MKCRGPNVEPLFLQALALHREVLGPDDPGTLRLIYGLSHGYAFNWQDGEGGAVARGCP